MKTTMRVWLLAGWLAAAGVEAGSGGCTTTTERAYVMTESSLIDALCYDAGHQELTVFLRTGAAYCYREVPESVLREFVRAESPGRFYHKQIRGQYPGRRLSDEEQVAVVRRHDGHTAW